MRKTELLGQMTDTAKHPNSTPTAHTTTTATTDSLPSATEYFFFLQDLKINKQKWHSGL